MSVKYGLVAAISVGLIVGCVSTGPGALSQPPSTEEVNAATTVNLPIAVSGVYGERDYANGIDLKITYRNIDKSRTIKYVTFDVSLLNAVGDVVNGEISHHSKKLLEATGPIKPNEMIWGAFNGWPKAIYHSNAVSVQINAIKVEFMNGDKTDYIKVNGLLSMKGDIG